VFPSQEQSVSLLRSGTRHKAFGYLTTSSASNAGLAERRLKKRKMDKGSAFRGGKISVRVLRCNYPVGVLGAANFGSYQRYSIRMPYAQNRLPPHLVE
jgi:hypothetical protein